MAYNSVHGRYFAGKQVTCEFVSLTKWKVAICGEYMKSRLKTCSRGSACNFLHCFSNPGGDYEWADCDKPPPRYWLKKMTALFGYSDDSWHDKQIDQPSPKDQQHSSRIFTSDRDSYYHKQHRSTEANQHYRNSSRNHHEEYDVRKSRSRDRQKDNKNYKDGTHNKYNQIAEDIDSDGDRLDRKTHTRHGDSSENHSGHHRRRRESKSKDYYGRSTRHSHCSSSSDEDDLYKDNKRRSQHRNKDSESSNDYDDDKEESKDARLNEAELQRHKQNKTNSTSYHHRRSTTRHSRDGESEEEIITKKQKRRSTTDRSNRSRSRDSSYVLDKNVTNDRWEPETFPNEHRSKENDRKSEDKRSSRERRSGSVEQDLNKLQGDK